MTDDTWPSSARAVDPRTDDASRTEWSVPDCPQCGRPVWVVTVSGPGTATAAPCGCAVSPTLLERERGPD